MLMHQEKLKFYVLIINLMLVKSFARPLRSALKRKASRTKQQGDIRKNKKERNLVVKLNRETKPNYFKNLETSKKSKPFWDKC